MNEIVEEVVGSSLIENVRMKLNATPMAPFISRVAAMIGPGKKVTLTVTQNRNGGLNITAESRDKKTIEELRKGRTAEDCLRMAESCICEAAASATMGECFSQELVDADIGRLIDLLTEMRRSLSPVNRQAHVSIPYAVDKAYYENGVGQ